MWMRPPRRRSRTSWSSTTGPCWSPIHVAASPRSSVDLELVPATRSPTVNSPVHFHNKLEEQRTSCVSFPFTKLYRWFAYSLSSSKGCLHVELKSMAANYSTLATIVGYISQNAMQLADYAFLWLWNYDGFSILCIFTTLTDLRFIFPLNFLQNCK